MDEVEPPDRLVFRDRFANDDGTPNAELPMTTARVTIQEIGGGTTRMWIESEFPTVEAMEQLAAMGMEEGLTQAVGDRRDPGRGSGRGPWRPAMTAARFDSSTSLVGYIGRREPHG